jgi:hypothetical protein
MKGIANTDVKGIMPKRDPFGGRFPMSRDMQSLPCRNTKCFLNGGGSCVSPAAVIIDNVGRCDVYQRQLTKEAEDADKKSGKS